MTSLLQRTVASTIGAWLIGAVTSIGLLGILTLQCWMYYSTFPRDPVWLKFLVALVWCLEVVRTAFCMHGGYYYAILHWGDLAVLLSPTWSMSIMIPLTEVLVLLVHFFFAHQVRSVTRGKYRILYYIIIIFSLGELGFGIASYATAVLDNTFSGIVFGLPSHLATIALCCAIPADWTITASLVSFLRKNKTTKTRTLMQTLILYSINFGLLISLTDLVVVIITNVKWPGVNLYQVSLFEVVGSLYANTMLASLNSRSLVAEHLYNPENLHFTSINVADLSRPSASDLENGDLHVNFSHSINLQVPTRTTGPREQAKTRDYESRLSERSSEGEGHYHKDNKIHGGL